MNLFDFALKMEADGKAYYTKLAAETELEGLKTIFSRLAEDEQRHYELFEKLKAGKSVPHQAESASLDNLRNIFKALPQPETALKTLPDSLAAYQHAMKVEAESLRLYEQAAETEQDPQTKSLLLKIAAEEQQHFNILENIHQFVSEPDQYLACAEFSNLDEIRQFGC